MRGKSDIGTQSNACFNRCRQAILLLPTLRKHLPHSNSGVSTAIMCLAIGASGEFLAINAGRLKLAIRCVAPIATPHYTLPGGRHTDGAYSIEDVLLRRFCSINRRASERNVYSTYGQLQQQSRESIPGSPPLKPQIQLFAASVAKMVCPACRRRSSSSAGSGAAVVAGTSVDGDWFEAGVARGVGLPP
jgi:hypothetical protein